MSTNPSSTTGEWGPEDALDRVAPARSTPQHGTKATDSSATMGYSGDTSISLEELQQYMNSHQQASEPHDGDVLVRLSTQQQVSPSHTMELSEDDAVKDVPPLRLNTQQQVSPSHTMELSEADAVTDVPQRSVYDSGETLLVSQAAIREFQESLENPQHEHVTPAPPDGIFENEEIHRPGDRETLFVPSMSEADQQGKTVLAPMPASPAATLLDQTPAYPVEAVNPTDPATTREEVSTRYIAQLITLLSNMQLTQGISVPDFAKFREETQPFLAYHSNFRTQIEEIAKMPPAHAGNAILFLINRFRGLLENDEERRTIFHKFVCLFPEIANAQKQKALRKPTGMYSQAEAQAAMNAFLEAGEQEINQRSQRQPSKSSMNITYAFASIAVIIGFLLIALLMKWI